MVKHARLPLLVAALSTAAVLGLTVLSPASPPSDRGRDNENDQDHEFNSRIRKGFAIAPVPLDLRGKNRALVGLGSYIVNAQGGCNDCHTNPPYAVGGDPFLGEPKVINSANYLAGGTPFGPEIFSANITPDETGKPAGLTRDEFIELIRTGVEENGELLQVMPWPVFQEMTNRDLRAIYEYLSSIPHAEPAS